MTFDLVIFDWAETMVEFGCRAPIEALQEALPFSACVPRTLAAIKLKRVQDAPRIGNGGHQA